MRLQLVGSYSLEEFQRAISVLIEDLQSNQINSLQDVSLDFRICNDGREIVLTNDGEEVEYMKFDFARRQQISTLSPNISIATLREKNPEPD